MFVLLFDTPKGQKTLHIDCCFEGNVMQRVSFLLSFESHCELLLIILMFSLILLIPDSVLDTVSKEPTIIPKMIMKLSRNIKHKWNLV